MDQTTKLTLLSPKELDLPQNKSGLHPLGQAILTKMLEQRGLHSKIIELPASVTSRLPALATEAVVLEIGPGPYRDEPCRVKVGDKVVLAAMSGSIRVGNDGEWYRIVNNRDIYCRIDEAPSE